MSYSPFGRFKQVAKDALKKAIASLFNVDYEPVLKVPPDEKFGELAFECFELSKLVGKPPKEVAKSLEPEVAPLVKPLFSSVKAEGAGYLNFYVNYAELASLTFSTVHRLKNKYGFVPAEKKLKIIVEHTSANPIHPIHVGTARNAVIGDCLAKLLRMRGHEVRTHFYVDDVGFQVAIAAYGFRLVDPSELKGLKEDLAVGLIYAATNALLELKELKKKYEDIKKSGDIEELPEVTAKIDERVALLAKLKSKLGSCVDTLINAFVKAGDPLAEIKTLDLRYEMGDPEAKKCMRNLCLFCIKGFKKTLERVGISFDSWDWESEVACWSSRVKAVINSLKSSGFTSVEDSALVLRVKEIIDRLSLREKLGIPKSVEVPNLILVRSDGRTLYTTRDIAYTLWQLELADKVFHVIGVDQKIPQLQLRIAIALIAGCEKANSVVHFSYELVRLPKRKMSARKGEFVSFDELLDEAKRKALDEIRKRDPSMAADEAEEVAERVGVGAIKYYLLSTSPNKVITFDWGKALNFEQNSGPFLQYVMVRINSLLSKAKDVEVKLENVRPELLSSEHEKRLILLLSKYPELIKEVSESLELEELTVYANKLAATFNVFYDNCPVLSSESPVKESRLMLVLATKYTLQSLLSILGIPVPHKM